MIRKTPKSGRKTVELQPSRIRREPPPRADKAPWLWMGQTTEQEAWTVAIGVMLFGVALAIITMGFSAITS